jgi:hypothetical protein
MSPEPTSTEPNTSTSQSAARPDERASEWAPRRRWSVAELIARALAAPPAES